MFILDRCISHKVSKDPVGALPPGAIPLAREGTSKSFWAGLKDFAGLLDTNRQLGNDDDLLVARWVE